MRTLLLFALLGGLCLAAGCGGGGPKSSTGGNTITSSSTTTNNVQALYVDTDSGNGYDNELFTTVTICTPGSATACQNIDHVLVDTGSSGLRIVASVLSASIVPGAVNITGSTTGTPGPGAECVAYGDGSYTWGALGTLDIKMGGTNNTGETASSAIVQLIGNNAGASGPPPDCSGTMADDTVQSLGANGIIGVGLSLQDCQAIPSGTNPCASTSNVSGLQYYSCPSGSCTDTEVTAAQQVVNPVSLFGTDSDGVIIELPTISNNGNGTTNGSMVFGIATTSGNNAISSSFPSTVQIYAIDANQGFVTQFNGNDYDGSFIDTGSNALYFLDATGTTNGDSTGMPLCSSGSGSGTFYCPGGNSPGGLSLDSLTVKNADSTGALVQVGNFNVANANTLLGTASTNAYNDLAGPMSGGFDFGLPFFYGRNIGFVFQNKTVTNISGTGPFYIY